MKFSVDLESSTVCLITSEYTLEFGFCFDEKNPSVPLYCVQDIENFFFKNFKIVYVVKRDILLLGMFKVIQDRIFVTEVGLKYVFSIIIGSHCTSANQLKERPFCKFVNSFYLPVCKISSTVLKKMGDRILDCKFCESLNMIPSDDTEAAEHLALQYKELFENKTLSTVVELDKSNYSNPEYILNVQILLEKAGQELKKLLNFDNLLPTQVGDDRPSAKVVDYNPILDLESNTSYLVKSFLASLSDIDFTDLGKVSLRNQLLLAGHGLNYPIKPVGAYFMGMLVKHVHDKKKLLQILGSLGVTVSYKSLSDFEVTASEEYNKNFHNIPPSVTINCAIDNNQKPVDTAKYSSLKDSHMAECMNIMQTVRPGGNELLPKVERTINEGLHLNFVEPSIGEETAGRQFKSIFLAQALEIMNTVPSDSLKTPKISNVLPIKVEDAEELVSPQCLSLYEKNGNLLKKGMLKLPQYKPKYSADATDPQISWDGANGNKTCLRNVVLGKSTNELVFLESLNYLYNTFHNPEREQVFLTMDQALYDVYQKLKSDKKLPSKFSSFFIAILDPFHLQWTMEKSLMSGFNEVLKEVFAIIGLDDQKWVGIRECKNVHKSHALLEELLIALQCFFVLQYQGHLEGEEKLMFDGSSDEGKAKLLSENLDSFLQEIKNKDKVQSVWIDILNAGNLCLMAWEAQRVENHAMFMFAFKKFLPFFFAFNNIHYQHSSVEFLRDLVCISDFHTDLLNSGVMFGKLSNIEGTSVSVGYLLELFNKTIKQLTHGLDASGEAWLRTLPKIPLIKGIFSNASNLELITDSESSPVKKLPNLTHILMFRYVFEKRNLLQIDRDNFSIKDRPCVNPRTGNLLSIEFVDCFSIGQARLKELVKLVLDGGLMGRLENERKQLGFSKVVACKKITPKRVMEDKKLSKNEKSLLVSNIAEMDLPMSSLSMVSPSKGASPYLDGAKSDAAKFLRLKYPCEIEASTFQYSHIFVDLMPSFFSNPPGSIYASQTPFKDFCHWYALTHIAPNFSLANCVVLCVDRKSLQKNFPIKSQTHGKRKGKFGSGLSLIKQLAFLLGTDIKLITSTYIPPHKQITDDRELRFQLIFKVMEELMTSPLEYFPQGDFQLIIDGVLSNGDDPHCMIVSCKNGNIERTKSAFTINQPEADQSIFSILRELPVTNALVRFMDTDILLTAVLAYDQLCRNDQRIDLQYLNQPNEVLDITLLRTKIAEDDALAHLNIPVQSSILGLLAMGKNDYTGKLYGISSCDLAYRALSEIESDLACPVNETSLNLQLLHQNHFDALVESGIKFTISRPMFSQFIKIIYILKNTIIFEADVSMALPKSVQKWKKPLLIKMIEKLSLKVDRPPGKKTITVDIMKMAIQKHFRENPAIRNDILDKGKTDGIPLCNFDYGRTAAMVWQNKINSRDWCPTEHQLLNLYGRIVLASIVFSVAKKLPDLQSLLHFVYLPNLENESVSFNLKTGATHKTAEKLLKEINSKKRKMTQTASTSSTVAKTNQQKRKHADM